MLRAQGGLGGQQAKSLLIVQKLKRSVNKETAQKTAGNVVFKNLIN